VTLLVFGSLFVAAGLWQLDRADQKRALFQAFDRVGGTLPLDSLGDDSRIATFRYRRFSVTGRYDSAHQVLLDSMSHDGKAGFQVLTPLLNAGKAILVNRGWIPQSADRSRLPDLAVDQRPRRITGRLDLLPRPGLILSPNPVTKDAGWPRRLLFPSAGEIERHLGYPVHHYQLLLAPDGEPGFVRDWRPAVSGPERNIGYAIQWFSFAGASLVIYLVLNLRRSGKGGS